MFTFVINLDELHFHLTFNINFIYKYGELYFLTTYFTVLFLHIQSYSYFNFGCKTFLLFYFQLSAL